VASAGKGISNASDRDLAAWATSFFDRLTAIADGVRVALRALEPSCGVFDGSFRFEGLVLRHGGQEQVLACLGAFQEKLENLQEGRKSVVVEHGPQVDQ